VYVGQLQSLSLVNNLLFIVDSEGVLTVIKAIFKSSTTGGTQEDVEEALLEAKI